MFRQNELASWHAYELVHRAIRRSDLYFRLLLGVTTLFYGASECGFLA